MSKRTMPGEGTTTLVLIGLFKFAKGILLVLVGIGALKLLHKDVAQTVQHWINLLRVDPDNRFIHRVLAGVFRITPHQLRALSLGTFAYAALFLTEGTGLLLRKRWAEYLTIISTAGLIPLEIYETGKHFTPFKIAVLIVNIAIVVYLVVRVTRHRWSENIRPGGPQQRISV